MSVLYGGLGVLGFALLLVLFSIDAVEPNEYGLIFNWVTKTLSKDVYHGGTHLVGFWNKFLVFPASVRTIEFSDRPDRRNAPMLHTRSKEGLALHLSISFQYKLNPDKLMDLFSVTNMDYEHLYTRIARDQLLEAASQYEGPQYWQERKNIGDHMRRLVSEQLESSYATLWDLQLQVIDLPDRYEASITQTQVQQQMIKTRENEQVAATIRADTEVLTADFMKQVQVVAAGAQANYTQQTKLAEAEASKRRIGAEAKAVGYVRKKLGLTPADLVRYQQLQSYSTLPNATFMADLPGAAPLVGMSVASRLLQEAVAPARKETVAPVRRESEPDAEASADSETSAPARRERQPAARADAHSASLSESFLGKRSRLPAVGQQSLLQWASATSRRTPMKPSEGIGQEEASDDEVEMSSYLQAEVMCPLHHH